MTDELEEMKNKLAELEKRIRLLETKINDPHHIGKLVSKAISTPAEVS